MAHTVCTLLDRRQTRPETYIDLMIEPPDDQRVEDFLSTVGRQDSFGLYELHEALHVLAKSNQEVGVRDIAQVERFWLNVGDVYSSAGFILLLHDGRRAYLFVWVEQAGDDGARTPKADIEFEILPAGQKAPTFPSTAEPLGGWREDIDVLNQFLFGIWQN